MGALELVLIAVLVAGIPLLYWVGGEERGARPTNGSSAPVYGRQGTNGGNGHANGSGNGHGKNQGNGQRWGGLSGGHEAYFRRAARQAGFQPDELRFSFWSSKILLALLLPLASLAFWPQVGMAPTWLWLSLAVIGFFLPDVWLELRRRQRRRQISWGLSYFVDMVVALLHSGLSPAEAFLRAGRSGFGRNHPLAREVELIGREIESGKDPAASFQALAERTGVPEIAVLAATVGVGARLGVPIVVSLESQADVLRTRRREEGLARINVAGVRAVFPVVLCGLPVLLALVFFPAVVQLFETLQSVSETVRAVLL